MNVIETQNLTKYYGKSRGILNVDLQIKKGEIFGFIGPNGAGKSTTIRTLLGLIYPTRGSGEIFGMDIVKKSREIKKRVGFMPSFVNYYDQMDVIELLQYSAGFYEGNFEDKIKELAGIFHLELDKKIRDLSQGNKRKVTILQSLIHEPELLILDEPTSGLDPLMQAHFFDILREENCKGTTIFFSSHTLSEVQKLCKRVAIIREGQIVAVEDIESLRKKQLKKISVEYEHPVDSLKIDCPGVISLQYKKNAVHFMFSGNINDLLKTLSRENIADLEIEEPTLEEIFMHYYEENQENTSRKSP